MSACGGHGIVRGRGRGARISPIPPPQQPDDNGIYDGYTNTNYKRAWSDYGCN